MFSEYPDFFARFYDLIYHKVRDDVDHLFYLDKIRHSEGKVLEIGAGTGRLFIDALNSGADIYGIDISRSMLDVLKNNLDKKYHDRVSLQNIIDFRFREKFDLIVAPFRVFMHLTEKEDQLKALNNVCQNLNRNGLFIFDTFVPDLNQLITGLDCVTDFDGEYEPGRKLKRIVSTRPDLVNQLINVTFRFEWDGQNKLHRSEWETCLRYFFRFELEHLVERSCFLNYSIKGDFKGNDLSKDSREFIMFCYN